MEAQVSFLQGQINDLEAMSKYCAKMMNTHIGKFTYQYIYQHAYINMHIEFNNPDASVDRLQIQYQHTHL